MRYATQRGWRSCVLNRRGHAGMDLTTPSFNIVGSPLDTKAQVELVRRRYPDSFLAMVGISAGCCPLMSYLGLEAANTPVSVAAALCPAYDIERAFRSLSCKVLLSTGSFQTCSQPSDHGPAHSQISQKIVSPQKQRNSLLKILVCLPRLLRSPDCA